MPRNDRDGTRLGRVSSGILKVQPEARLSLLVVGTMTLKAGIRQNRTDVAIKRNAIRPLGGGEAGEAGESDHRENQYLFHQAIQ